ncbi:MAG: hypothetical protein ACRDZZ_02450, partial [Ilumatobacteraceae bacterium]
VHLTDYGTKDRHQDHELAPGDKITLRDDYVPTSEAKLTKALQTPGEYGDLALGVAYNDYLEFMNSAFIQKATNFVHDHFCVNGLDVQSGDGWSVFRIYGDDNMFKQNASRGLVHSGLTARMSRNSIVQVAQNGVEDPGHTTRDILTRLPDKVQLDPNTLVGLDEWHSDALRTQCEKSIFPSMSDFGKNQTFNKVAPGLFGGALGKITKDPAPHGSDVF